MIAIVVSRADAASEHIGEHLLDLADWEVREDDSRPDGEGGGRYYRLSESSDTVAADDGHAFELREFDDLHLEIEGAAEAFGEARSASKSASGEQSDPRAEAPDLLVFASKHSGDTGPLLTAHFTGNFGPAKYGGDDHALAEACPNARARLLDGFEEYAPDGYEVGMECTHHGPSSVGVPSLFAELGSDEAQWDDPEGARAVARAILDLDGVEPHRERQLVGFGGGHYVPRFERIERTTDWAVGHVSADWGLEAMGSPAEHRDVIEQAFEASRAERAVIDGDYPELEDVVSELNYEVVGETWVRETTGVPLELVADLESDLSPVADGLRFGEPAAGYDPGDSYETVSLPDDLLAEAQGIDAEAVREAVVANALAFETEQNGTRARGRAAVRERGDSSRADNARADSSRADSSRTDSARADNARADSARTDSNRADRSRSARERLLDSLADVLAEKYDSVAREDGAIVARVTAFDPEKARKLGVPEGPAFGKLSAGESVAVDGEEIDPEAVQSERTQRFSI